MSRVTAIADFAAVALGGAVGSMLRHGLTKLSVALPGGSHYLGTLAANVLGCLAIGVLAGALAGGATLGARRQLALRTGVLGGLTTFSTFAIETVLLAGENRIAATILYLIANLALGIVAVLLGMLLGRAMATIGS